MSFESFELPARLEKNIETLGWAEPTPIQEKALPPALDGRDLLGLAQTGSGKTGAFLIPLVTRILESEPTRPGAVRALVLAPTRELAEQIKDAALALTRGTRVRVSAVYGGASYGPQLARFRQGVEILVACPGRLLDHMEQGAVDLSYVEALVLDEADHMFDMGFLPGVKRIVRALPEERQTMLFSATMPDSIRGLAREVLTDPEEIRIGRSAPTESVCQSVYPCPQGLKAPLLMELLKDMGDGSVIVFTKTKHRAKRLAERIDQAGLRAASLQGNLSQSKRLQTLDGFRRGRFQVLVATDVAARGVDVKDVAHVVNFDVPNTPEAYTHRIGRTGRAGAVGEAHTLYARDETHIIRAVERLIGKRLPERRLDGFDYAQAPEREPRDDSRAPRSYDQGRRRLSGDRPGSDRAASDRPVSDRQHADRPHGDRPHGDRPGGAPSKARFGAKKPGGVFGHAKPGPGKRKSA